MPAAYHRVAAWSSRTTEYCKQLLKQRSANLRGERTLNPLPTCRQLIDSCVEYMSNSIWQQDVANYFYFSHGMQPARG